MLFVPKGMINISWQQLGTNDLDLNSLSKLLQISLSRLLQIVNSLDALVFLRSTALETSILSWYSSDINTENKFICY